MLSDISTLLNSNQHLQERGPDPVRSVEFTVRKDSKHLFYMIAGVAVIQKPLLLNYLLSAREVC